jgi:outer membrane protein
MVVKSRVRMLASMAARTASYAAISLGASLLSSVASAESLSEALALAYSNNPTINAARAEVRSFDENVPIAKSALRPQVGASAEYGSFWSETTGLPLIDRSSTNLNPGAFGVTISQTLFDGFATRNNVMAAQSAIFAGRETLRNTEQNVLFDAASAYMDVIRDQQIVGFRTQALEFLSEQVRSERTRFEVGESTRTDVAQAEASQAGAVALLADAKARLQSSIAIYRQVIGKDPEKLRYPPSIDKLLPKNVDSAVSIGFEEHPAILATKYLVDQADWNVRSAESDLLPRVDLEGRAFRAYDQNVSGTQTDSASVTARLTVPIYQGGRVSATVRQNKEILGQRWIEVDQAVDNVRAAIVSAYSQLLSARASITANEAQLRAANLALEGIVEERKVGQSTTLDVLRTQQGVIDAQLQLAEAQRNSVVAAYALLSAVGRLNSDELKLAVVRYDPDEHYTAVKDKWFGLRTPDGR